MKKYLFCLFLTFSFTISCTNEIVKEDYRRIDLLKAIGQSERKTIDAYCKSISYVKLETRDDVLLKSPFYEFTPNTIIAYEGASLYQFSYKGEFLNSYVNIGKGPKDLLGINKVMWNEDHRMLYVLDGALGKMLILDENLNYQGYKPYRVPEHRSEICGDYIYSGLERDDYRKMYQSAVVRYHIPSADCDTLFKSTIPYCEAKEFPMFSFGTKLSFSDSVFYFREHRSDTIFSFTPVDNVKRFAYSLNVGETYPPELDYNHQSRRDLYDYLVVGDCVYCDDFIIVCYSYKDERLAQAVFDKKTGETFCLRNFPNNGIDGGLPIRFIKKVKGKTYYSGQIFPGIHLTDEFKSRVKFYRPWGCELSDILASTLDDDNPILMFVEIK